MKTELLKKHHFWILFGAVPLLVGLLLILLYSGPAEAIGEESAKYKKRSDEAGAANAKGVGMLAELAKQKETLEERREQLWSINYDRQKKEGVFAWPGSGRDKYLKDLEKLDLRFGATGLFVGTLDAAKEADTQFLMINDEMSKFTAPSNYYEAYKNLATVVQPTQFSGGGWQAVLRHVTDWGNAARPDSSLFWLAVEDFWIQRALLKPIAEVNANAAKFELVPAAAGTENLLNRKFQNRTWEIDIEVGTEGANRVLKSKLKNKTDRLQMLGLNKTMRLNVWFDDPKLDRSKPFEYRIGGELVKGSGELIPKIVPELHKIPAGLEPVTIYKIEQILDETTVPVRIIRRIELGFRDAKRATVEMKTPSFFPEEAAVAEATTGNSGSPISSSENGPPGGIPGNPYGSAGLGGNASSNRGTPEQVLLGNKKRYTERTEQVRRMPIGMDLVVDQAYVNDVLIALGNSPLRIQITQTQWQRFREQLTVSGSSSAPGGLLPSSPGTGGSGGGDDDATGSGGPKSPNPFGSGAGMGGGFGTTTSALPTEQVTAGLVELAIYGLVSVYEKTKPKPVDPNKPVEAKADVPKPEAPIAPPNAPTPPPK